jgi:exosortase family protein XrtG
MMKMVYFLGLVIIWSGMILFFRRNRVWLLYYLFGAVGLTYGFVFLAGQFLGGEQLLAESVAGAVHGIASSLNIPTRIFSGAPGMLLVMVIYQDVGWTMLQIGVESSGILEISVLISLLSFYPGWRIKRRLGVIGFGVLAVWIANIFRMLVIVILLHRLGKGALVLAHTYIGKIVFFILTVAIFWYLITTVSLADIQKDQARLKVGN